MSRAALSRGGAIFILPFFYRSAMIRAAFGADLCRAPFYARRASKRRFFAARRAFSFGVRLFLRRCVFLCRRGQEFFFQGGEFRFGDDARIQQLLALF